MQSHHHGLMDIPSASLVKPQGLGIAAVERDTGLSKDTLRIWERRYQFPLPARDAYGERIYPADQVDKLRVIKRLMDQGMRPGKIMHHSLPELHALKAAHPEPALSADLANLLDLILTHRVEDLRGALAQHVLKIGLARFVIDIVVPLNTAVGQAWVQGDLAIFEEHLYTESVKIVLRSAIASVPRQIGSPRVLLTTFPREEHGLGLLMVEALLALEGAHCVSLGVETPVADIVRAADSQHADIIALSFSAAYPANGILDGLAVLRASLPAHVEIWAGGAAAVLMKRPPGDVRVMGRLESIAHQLAAWRAARDPAHRD